MRRLLRNALRLLRILGTGWSILGLTLLLVLLGELGLRGIFWLKDRGKPTIPPDPRVLAAIEGSAGWLPDHYRELEGLSDRWQPYVYFRQRPFRGRTIHIDDEGLRTTWQPPSRNETNGAEARPLKLLMLGGSSLWGFGARDEATIPSFVARGLHDRGIAAEVRNLAEIGYVNTQEVMALLRELQAGYRPEVVVCYDGVNDTTAALLGREAGITTNEVNRVREFNILQSSGRLTAALGSSLVRDSGWARVAGALGRKLASPVAPGAGLPAGDALRPLAREVVRRYEANIGLVKALGREYGFRPLFVWQPTIFDKPTLVEFEREEAAKYGWTQEIFRQVRSALADRPELKADQDFQDLGDLFGQQHALVFLDFCHTTEEANRLIADQITDRIFAHHDDK